MTVSANGGGIGDLVYQEIWSREIEPELSMIARPSMTPTTVFLGAQPGAGKTRGQSFIRTLYDRDILPIVGDDFRQFHLDYEDLIDHRPLSMPDVTAKAAGMWTGMAVRYADDHQVSCIIEGTWRAQATVLNEARLARRFHRGTHAVVLSVPPAMSRLAILARFYHDMEAKGVARWTPPAAHENTVKALDANVPAIAGSGLFDRLTVFDRAGDVLYDGHDADAFTAAWSEGFHRPLTAFEASHARDMAARLHALHDEYTPDNEDAERILGLVEADAQVAGVA